MKALKYALLGAGAAALAAGALAAYLVVTFDARDYEPRIVEMVKARTGRTLAFRSATRLSFWPDLGVRLGPVTLSERNSDDAFAEVENARFALRLKPLLSKELVADELVLQGARVRITRFADGRLNIDDLFGSEGPPPVFDIGRVKVERSAVSFRDSGSGAAVELTDVELVTGRLVGGVATPVTLSLKARDGARSYDLASAVEGRLTFDFARRTYDLADATVRVDGRAGPLADLSAVLKGSFNARLSDGEMRMRPLSIAANGSIGGHKLQTRVAAAGVSLGKGSSIAETVTVSIESGSGAASMVTMALPRVEWREGELIAESIAVEADVQRAGSRIRATAHAALKADARTHLFQLTRIESVFTGTGPSLPKAGVKGALSGSASVEWAAQRVNATLAGRVSESNIKATLGMTGFTAPAFTFAADIDALDAARFAGSSTADGAGGGGGFDLAALSALPATGTLRIGTLKTAGGTAKNVRFVVKP